MSARRKCPLVLIEWEDSRQPVPSWRFLADVSEPPDAVTCASVGWLIHDTKRVKVLAPNMGGLHDGGDSVQACGLMSIPTRCVVKITKLKEPKR